MSSSEPDSKIDLQESAKEVERKLKKAFCEEGNVTENPILSFVKAVIFPILSLKSLSPEFVIKRPEKYGGNIIFKSHQELSDAFEAKIVHPGDLKKGAADALNELLEPIRQKFSSPELVKLTNEAYPPPVAKVTEEISRLGKYICSFCADVY